MYFLKQQFIRWLNDNLYVIREGQSSWVFHPKSGLGCLIFFLLFVVSLIISLGVTSIMIFKIYPIVFSTLITRLGIAPGLGLPLLIAVFLGYFINLPLFILTAKGQSKQQVSFELLPLLLFKRCLPSYKTPSKIYGYIGLNVSGGLLPIILALYQFHRVQQEAILIVTAVVGLISYFLVTIIPGIAIVTKTSRFWLITIVAVLSAMALVGDGVNRYDVSVAFAGCETRIPSHKRQGFVKSGGTYQPPVKDHQLSPH
ncbi:DUF1614 domain-containing protein [Microcoleus sp. K5-D4]|uniref:DUF1614 domain-containing protein n=1 Tax=Microcoleus sp. K5-D4 TaxID=2818801 RepID=UPI002FCF1F3F